MLFRSSWAMVRGSSYLGQIVQLMSAWLRTLFLSGSSFRRRPLTARRGFIFVGALLHHPHRRIQPVCDEWAHVLSGRLARTATAEVGNDGIGNLRVADRIFAFPNQLTKQIHPLLPDLGLSQNLTRECMHPRRTE